MKTVGICCAILVAVVLSSPAVAQRNELGWTMEGALRQLDRQGSDLETVLAEVSVAWESDAGANERLSSGRIYINKYSDYRISTASADGMQILYNGSSVYYYSSGQARVAEYRLARHRDRVEPYLTLGFTITGRDLGKDYLVTFIGEERGGERRLLGLELTPKRDQVRASVSSIELWVDQASWLPARQVINFGSGDGRVTLEYSQTSRNLNLNPDLFAPEWPKGTQKLRR